MRGMGRQAGTTRCVRAVHPVDRPNGHSRRQILIALAGRAQGAGQQSIVIKLSDRSIQYLNGAHGRPAAAESKISVGLMPSLARHSCNRRAFEEIYRILARLGSGNPPYQSARQRFR